MRATRSLGLVLAALLSGSAAAAADRAPPQGYVADAATAAAIGEAVLSAIHGKENIRKQEPFTAELKGDMWIVSGTRHCGSPPACFGIPNGTVAIMRRDGRILYAFQTD